MRTLTLVCKSYLEPWHADIFEFLDLRKNVGKEEIRARDLFLGLWVPDLFMRRKSSIMIQTSITQISNKKVNNEL